MTLPGPVCRPTGRSRPGIERVHPTKQQPGRRATAETLVTTVDPVVVRAATLAVTVVIVYGLGGQTGVERLWQTLKRRPTVNSGRGETAETGATTASNEAATDDGTDADGEMSATPAGDGDEATVRVSVRVSVER